HSSAGRAGPLALALPLPALDELAHLPPNGIEHPQEVLIGLADLVAEELHHAEEAARADDRETNRAMQSASDRVGRPWEIEIARHVGYPRRAPGVPDAPWQAEPARKGGAPVHAGEFVEGLRGSGPHLSTPEHAGLPVHGPARAQHPVEALPHRAKDLRH